MRYGYIRVSTDKQDLGRQKMALEGQKLDKVYQDKRTGSNTQRPGLDRLRLEVKAGDHVYIESISRLGRNVDDLRAICQELKDKGVTVHFLREGLNTDGDTFRFLLTILGAVAEMEREEINYRIKQGIEKAQKYGTKSGQPIGRPKRELPKDWDKYYPKWKAGEITAVELARLLEVSRSTLYRNIREYEGE